MGIRMAALVAVAATLAVLVAVPAEATVRKVAFTAVVSPNDYARLEVRVSPRARCSITVIYSTGESEARGLRRKTGV